MSYVKVMCGEEVVELPLEEGGGLLLSTIQSQFPSAGGLKYRNEETHSMRAVRATSAGVLSAPDDFWGDRVYLIVPKGPGDAAASPDASSKRKADDLQNDPKKKTQTCYRCGGEGHIQEMCSSAEGSRSSNAPECHLCHGKGHIKARCPNQIPAGVCYRCGVYGHSGRDCKGAFYGGGGGGYGFGGPRPDFPPQGRGFGIPPPHFPMQGGMGGMGGGMGGMQGMSGPGDRVCYRCHMPGHMAAQCPQGGGPSNPNACFKCGLDGHLARNCEVCFNCKQNGHMASNCPMARS